MMEIAVNLRYLDTSTRRSSSSPMNMPKRATAWNAQSFCNWARAAATGEHCVYHVGNLAADRPKSSMLHDLAEVVMFHVETGYVSNHHHRTRLPMVHGYTYTAIRTGGGYAPRSLWRGLITIWQLRALQAVFDCPADMSAVRAIRDEIGRPDDVATDMLATLKRKRWVREAEGRGWELTDVGLGVLV